MSSSNKTWSDFPSSLHTWKRISFEKKKKYYCCLPAMRCFDIQGFKKHNSFSSVFSDNLTEKRCLLWSMLIKPPSVPNLVLSPAALSDSAGLPLRDGEWKCLVTTPSSPELYLRLPDLQPWHDVLENHVTWFFPIGCGIWWLTETQMCIPKRLQYHCFFFLREPKTSTRKWRLLNVVLSSIFHS